MNKAFLFLLLLSSPIVAYQPLQSVVWKQCTTSEYIANYNGEALPINYRFCTVGSNITSDNINKEIKKDTKAIFEYADALGYPGTQCVENSSLEIYDIKVETLNESGRFPQWVNASPNGIWSLYDPRVKDYNTSSLMLTDQGEEWNKITFAHELSHYWYDRLCWNKHQPDPERFAMDFERFYLRSNK
jgi:hypothetical protein